MENETIEPAGAASPNEGVPGIVYILCFNEPFKQTLHYIGWAKERNFDRRMRHHRSGTGSKFMRAVCIDAGIDFVVSRTFKDKSKNFERQIKKQKLSRFFARVAVKNLINCRAIQKAIRNRRGAIIS